MNFIFREKEFSTNPLNLVEIKSKTTPKVVITNKVASKINSLHRNIKGIEWSGMLVYKFKQDYSHKEITEGKIEILVQDIILFDIGTPGGTGFKLDMNSFSGKKLQDYLLNGYKQGFIHTHHNMRTFFSGTDNDELKDNTPNYSYYLSMIVNYEGGGDPIARFCFNIESEVKRIVSFFNFNSKNTYNEKEKAVGYMECKVVYEEEDIILTEIKEVRKQKEEERKTALSHDFNVFGGNSWSSKNNRNTKWDNSQISLFDEDLHDSKINRKEEETSVTSVTQYYVERTVKNFLVNVSRPKILAKIDVDEMSLSSVAYIFKTNAKSYLEDKDYTSMLFLEEILESYNELEDELVTLGDIPIDIEEFQKDVVELLTTTVSNQVFDYETKIEILNEFKSYKNLKVEYGN